MLSIGISCRMTEALHYNELRNSLAVDWITYFNKLEFIPVLIPHGISDIGSYINSLRLDGVILSGGNNVNPKLYASDNEINSVYDMRDSNEYEIIRYCINNDLPLIGMCRGMYIINVFFNGRVSHNIKNHVNVKHDILINRFNDYFGDKKVVNSFLEHAIKPDDLASDMKYFAISKDGCVEGMYNIKKSIFGIQWHPERTPFDLGVAAFIRDIMKKKIN